MPFISYLLSIALLFHAGIAEPQPQGLVGDLVGVVDDLPLVSGVLSDLATTLGAASALLAKPTAVKQAASRLSSVIQAEATQATMSRSRQILSRLA